MIKQQAVEAGITLSAATQVIGGMTTMVHPRLPHSPKLPLNKTTPGYITGTPSGELLQQLPVLRGKEISEAETDTELPSSSALGGVYGRGPHFEAMLSMRPLKKNSAH